MKIGKATQNGFYVHVDAIKKGEAPLAPAMRQRHDKATTRLLNSRYSNHEYNLVCIQKDRVRFLLLNLSIPHPYVTSSVVVHDNGTVERGRISQQIYHRMETMLSPSSPLWAMHNEITRWEEEAGIMPVYENGKKKNPDHKSPPAYMAAWMKYIEKHGWAWDDYRKKVVEIMEKHHR